MSGSVNKAAIVADYVEGMSLTEVACRYGLSVSTARYHVLKAGVLRSRSDGIRNAASRGKLGGGMRGKVREFSSAHRKAISEAALSRWESVAVGKSVKPSGYIEITRGPNKGRSEHVVVMEARLGRRLFPDEHVHHIDGDRQNNSEDNLALVTSSGHARLHRLQDAMSGIKRERKENGRFR